MYGKRKVFVGMLYINFAYFYQRYLGINILWVSSEITTITVNISMYYVVFITWIVY
jgi:hypothetical protein